MNRSKMVSIHQQIGSLFEEKALLTDKIAALCESKGSLEELSDLINDERWLEHKIHQLAAKCECPRHCL